MQQNFFQQPIVDLLPPYPDQDGPNPQDAPKRRRIRKRKRRPVRIHSLEEANQPWDLLPEEVNQKTHNRRRLIPVYEEETILEPSIKQKKQTAPPQFNPSDLKNLLKQTGGSLSLSEILQQKNLSLSELLNGNQQAILALKTTTETPPTPMVLHIDRNFERSQESVEEPKERIFVPPSKLYTSMDYDRPEIILNDDPRTLLPKRLPVTSAKLNKLAKDRVETVTKLPESAFTISVNEVIGYRKNSTESPLRIDLMENIETTTEATTIPSAKAEKVKIVTAKEEIMEILNDPKERENLSKILQTRNMTVDELVEQRERGSSQRHLADIFHNKTKEPEAKEEPTVGHVTINKPLRQQKSKIIEESKPEDYSITSFPTFKIESNKNPDEIFPWKLEVFPEIYHETENYKDVDNSLLTEEVNDKIDVNLYEDDDDFITLPSGVKSAIFASLAIIGLSLVVFLTIFVIFKWTQRHKRRMNYCGSFSKIKSPILESEQKRSSFKTFMTETLGRRKNFYRSQSISDNIWENEKKSYF